MKSELYLCGKEAEKFPYRIMKYPTNFYNRLKSLDYDSVREYIYYEHPIDVIRSSEKLPKIVSKKMIKNCIVWICEAIDEEKLLHPLGGSFSPQKDFCQFNKGDMVSVHWDFALERTNEDFAKDMNERLLDMLNRQRSSKV